MLDSKNIVKMIQDKIVSWHKENECRPKDYKMVDEKVLHRKEIGEHRDDITEVIDELTNTNLEMWHEEDKIRSEDDETVLRAIRNVNPLNQHRNDLIEEIDEIVVEKYQR